jgi:hypothetical protein
MVNMRMRNDDLRELQVVGFEHREDVLNVISGIDHQRFAAFFVRNDGTIAAQHAYREDFMQHSAVTPSQSCEYYRRRDGDGWVLTRGYVRFDGTYRAHNRSKSFLFSEICGPANITKRHFRGLLRPYSSHFG